MEGDVIRMGGYQGPASVHNRAAYVLGKGLSERTHGENTLTLIEDVTKLGRNSLDLFDMVEGNELDLCYFASSYLVHRVPNLAVFDLPFAIESREKIYDLLDNGLGEEIKADVAKRTGFVVLGFWDNGFAISPTASARSSGRKIAGACRSAP
jgi:TRAP-type C4-dicarboxylate transport system substrate-binding protein